MTSCQHHLPRPPRRKPQPSDLRIALLALLSLSGPLGGAIIPSETVKSDVFGVSLTSLERVLDPIEGPQLALDFEALTDLPYEIHSSIDAEHWEVRGSVTPNNGEGLFVEPFPPAPRRFYQVVFAGTGDTVAPTWPANASLVIEANESYGVELSWPAANDEALIAYALYRNGVHIATFDPSVQGAFLDGLAPNTVYEFDLVACDPGGNCTQLDSSRTLRTRTRQEPSLNAPQAGSVLIGSGEFVLSRTDMAIPARELGFQLTRTYRSNLDRSGPLGYGWSTNVFEDLHERPGGDVVWRQGNGRSDPFTKLPDDSYASPPGVFATLSESLTGFRLVAPDGTTRHFDLDGHILSITTRNGNALTFLRSGGRLTSLRDDMGRETAFEYDPNGRLTRITDFTGRSVVYGYDPQGNLISVRSPLVTGTPTGNDFPAGRIERYVYDTANPDPDRAHNLIGVIAPNEVADGTHKLRQVITYGDDEANHDRVLTHTVGGVNASGIPAGGIWHFAYLRGTAVGNPGNVPPVERTTVTDPRGNDVHYEFDVHGHVTRKTEVLAGRDDPVTTHTYDAEGNLLATTHPEGNVTTCTYDSSNPSRRSQGNLLGITRTPGPRGAAQAQLATTLTYEPIYNQVRTVTDPRGNTTTQTFDYEESYDTAALALVLGTTHPEILALFSAAGMNPAPLGDLNNDDITNQVSGNVLRRDLPTVTLDPNSNQAALEGTSFQDGTDLFVRNRFGQLVRHRDAEHNVHKFTYFPERDPSGDGNIDNPAGDPDTGGYLSMTVRDAVSNPVRNSGTDPAPTRITTRFEYNPRGAPIARFDPRGVRTRIIRNQLDEPIQIFQADFVDAGHPNLDPEPVPPTPFGYFTEFRYDANGNVVQVDVEDRGNPSNPDGKVTTSRVVSIVDLPVASREEANEIAQAVTRYRYDPNGNLALVILPEGNAIAHRYDERNLLLATTTGATAPPPEALVEASQTYNPFGGTPSTTHYAWTDNGLLASVEDAADTDGSGDNNGPFGGDLTTFHYDGYNRLICRAGSMDWQAEAAYDPNGNLILTELFGPDGGPSPTTRNPSDNLLAQAAFHYDERNRLVRSDRLLFANTTAADLEAGAASLGKGDLLPGDGAVNRLREYDRAGRLTFEGEDDGDVTSYRYDGAGRLIQTTDPAGNSVEIARCDVGNMIERRETDRSTLAGTAPEVFLTTFLYDALNRRTTVIENGGQTTRFDYDSRGNLIATSDANGPPAGVTITRRAFPDAPTTINAINGRGNVTRHRYDGLNRRIGTVRILTASGMGDGTLTPTPDPNQGGGDGLITTETVYNLNNLVVARIDDNGFGTSTTHDNLDRPTTQSHGECLLPLLSGYTCDPPTTIQFIWDPDHNLVQKTDETGNVFNYTYDAGNRLILTDAVPFSATNGATQQTFEYDGANRLTKCTDNQLGAAVSRHYDSLSRLVAETTEVPGVDSFTTRRAWSAENLCRSLTYPTGTVLTRQFDALDRIAQIEDGGNPVADYHYLGSRLLRESYANGMKNNYSYDRVRRPVQVESTNATGAMLTRFDYSWDRTTNRLSESRAHDSANSELYAYDSAYRLTSVTRPNPGSIAPLQSSWSFDGSGNWTKVNGVPRVTSSFNEIAGINSTVGPSVALASDDNGNLTTDPTSPDGAAGYEYDLFNRLVSVNNGGTNPSEFGYDALGRRITESNGPDHEVVFIHDDQNVIIEWDARGDLIGTPGTPGPWREYVQGPSAVCNDGTPAVYYAVQPSRPVRYEDHTGAQFFYHQNSMGSICALTPAAGNGAERISYDAYGAATVTQVGGLPPTGNPLLHHARRKGAGSSLYYNRARFYDPNLGRFLTRDPLGMWGDPTNLGNGYSYCGNNPINRTDPSGLLELEDGGLEMTDEPPMFATSFMKYDDGFVAYFAGQSGSGEASNLTAQERFGDLIGNYNFAEDRTFDDEVWNQPVDAFRYQDGQDIVLRAIGPLRMGKSTPVLFEAFRDNSLPVVRNGDGSELAPFVALDELVGAYNLIGVPPGIGLTFRALATAGRWDDTDIVHVKAGEGGIGTHPFGFAYSNNTCDAGLHRRSGTAFHLGREPINHPIRTGGAGPMILGLGSSPLHDTRNYMVIKMKEVMVSGN